MAQVRINEVQAGNFSGNIESKGLIREAVGIFDDEKKLVAAIDELQVNKFDRHEISVLGDEKAMKQSFGKESENAQILEDHPSAPRRINIAPEDMGVARAIFISFIAYIFAVIAYSFSSELVTDAAIAIAAVAGIAGGLISYFAAKYFMNRHAQYVERQIKDGGLLLWVKTPTREKERKATEILERLGAKDVHIHNIAA